MVLAVAAWLLLLGFTTYYVCLPDLEEVSNSLRAIREDPNLTLQEKLEKSRAIFSQLTPEQGRRVFQNDKKKWDYERNAEMQKFLKMSPEEQVAYVKKMQEERKKFGPIGPFAIGDAVKVGPGGPGGGAAGGGAVRSAAAGGAGGRGMVFYGPPGGGGPGAGLGNPSQMQKNMLDSSSPETRAGQSYQKGLAR